MRIYKREINGIKVTAYNDSGVDWVVEVVGGSIWMFPQNKFTMKESMKMAADIAA